MVRAAAKNYNDVTVITSPNQYSNLINELNENKSERVKVANEDETVTIEDVTDDESENEGDQVNNRVKKDTVDSKVEMKKKNKPKDNNEDDIETGNIKYKDTDLNKLMKPMMKL